MIEMARAGEEERVLLGPHLIKKLIFNISIKNDFGSMTRKCPGAVLVQPEISDINVSVFLPLQCLHKKINHLISSTDLYRELTELKILILISFLTSFITGKMSLFFGTYIVYEHCTG